MPRLMAFFLLTLSASAAPVVSVTLKNLNLKPDQHLGQTVSVEGVLTRNGSTQGERRILAIGYTQKSMPTGLKFLAAGSLVESLFAAMKTDSVPVRLIGTVVAPDVSNGRYIVEVEAVMILDAQGRVVSSHKPSAAKPAPVAAVAQTPPPAPAAVETPTVEEPAPLPMQTIVAAAIAGVVGLIVAGLLIRRQRLRAKAAAAPPPLSVSERLNRRVR